ncbi:MAG: hypothetical protein LBK45_00060 [Tannerellaceae bacterium]|jgi:hypothetical protein|nr:hypothetical protein [Tannerellaceae bacterium]
MDKAPLTLTVQSSVINGRTQSGDIVAYYEQRIFLPSGATESLLVSFLKDESDGEADVNETSLNASIEYANGFFRCHIKKQENVPELWDVFWQLFNQLKNGE